MNASHLPQYAEHLSRVYNGYNGSPDPIFVRQAESAPSCRIAATQLVNWILRQYHMGEREPLEVKASYSWSPEVTLLAEAWPAMSEIFELRDGEIDFKQDVRDVDRDAFCAAVAARCISPMMT